ncbi:AzlC family ABC transporter permease [Aquiluna sp. KACHI24]|uniref:AzlC family ABC transporter permease n=1 Tax=Aquiluna sp. KACHI24 TaxID=2968831 RepID=UPI002205CDE7|nr:AzlC family ABC transporter permease [Aquiluna sp. KACHI24]BDQ00391.1 branched-chain amino acid ABC transporter permease [Aquiluna sp. KACHI24]
MDKVTQTSLSVSLATGLYGISFGALATAAGLELLPTMLLSLLMFSGASQFALVGVFASGGTALAAILSAWLMGIRNSFYALRLRSEIAPRGVMRLLAAQFTIDESNAVHAAQSDQKSAVRGFWLTGVGIYLLWNLATLAGALAGSALGSVEAWGLDAAAAAAFLGLLWPMLKGKLVLALVACGVGVALTPAFGSGTAILLTALVALVPRLVRS